MKISLALGAQQPLNRQTAWGCLTTNLAMPGVGSLVAGRRSGYAQLALALLSLSGTLFFGVRFFSWLTANWSRVYQAEGDPVTTLLEMWQALRWAVFSIAAFLVSWLWALATSFFILQSVRKEEGKLPPRFY